MERARALPGLRLVLTAGLPGPWGEAAKGVFHAKGVPFARVAQAAGQPNDDLFAWTGHRNAPVAVYADEPPRTGWAEILWLAERLAPEPALVPADPELRVQVFGLCHELMGENGLGWCRRLMLFQENLGDAEEPPEALRTTFGRMLRQYGWSPAAGRAAPERVAEIVRHFAERLAAQRAAGRSWLAGDRLTAVDIFWAAMAGILAPLPAEACALSDGMRAMYTCSHPRVTEALDPALLEHRDRIYRDHMEHPVRL